MQIAILGFLLFEGRVQRILQAADAPDRRAKEKRFLSSTSRPQTVRWLAENGPKELELLFRAILFQPSREASAGASKLLGLPRMEDALFDYDRATIRTDATVVLKDDVNAVRGILANYPTQKLVIQGNADETFSVPIPVSEKFFPGCKEPRRNGAPERKVRWLYRAG